MNRRFSCTLNGMSPESIDPAVRVTDLTELPPRTRVVTAPTGKHGLQLLQRVRESLTVRVHFVIAEYDPMKRRSILQKLHAWADPGGVLTTSDRPGQHLSVSCDTLPMMSALSWSDEMTLEFTAYSTPFWEMDDVSSVTTDSTAVLTLEGNADECPVSVLAVNNGTEPLTTLTLKCGDTAMTFTELTLAPQGTFSLRLDNGMLQAEAEGVSVLMNRTADSSDLLLAAGGTNTPVLVTADQPISAEFTGRGRLL